MNASRFPLVAVDIGNSRVKLGLFDRPPGDERQLPAPASTLDWLPQRDDWTPIDRWLGKFGSRPMPWWIASVQRQTAARLLEWLPPRANGVRLLVADDLPLRIAVPRPELVGIDRLLGAVAANRLRPPGTSAVVVDLGTAITVDLVGADGAFRGGAILPGIGLSARALHEFTDLLPLLAMTSLDEPPAPLGTDTRSALEAGIYWGAIGATRELTARMAAFSDDATGRAPELFLTGGAAPGVAELLSPTARYEPHLVLAGIAVTAGWVADDGPVIGQA